MGVYCLRIRCCLVIAVLLAPRAGQAADKWLLVRSRNFVLVGNASESSIKRVGRELEEFRSALGNLFPGVKQESPITTTVVVFKDEFVSYVQSVKDSFSCGKMNPEIPIAVIYRRSADRRFLGEPMRVEFVERN